MLAWILVALAVWLLTVAIYRGLRGPRAPRRVPPSPRRPRRGLPREDVEHVLYRVDWALWRPGRPCYFGITNNLAERQAGHARRSWWWPLSTRRLTVIGRFPSRSAALAAERRTIRTAVVSHRERLTNTQHNPRPVRRHDVRLVA
jgi:predicted GIY-YIG superfamily endonuclease